MFFGTEIVTRQGVGGACIGIKFLQRRKNQKEHRNELRFNVVSRFVICYYSFIMHAKQTRLGLFTNTTTDYGKFNTRIETDFYGSGGNQTASNSYGLRLRRAYGELGNLLVGQEWSTFIDLASYPETIDFGGPAGSLFVRQAQIRWT
jgi:hypothetical protein